MTGALQENVKESYRNRVDLLPRISVQSIDIVKKGEEGKWDLVLYLQKKE